MRYVLFSLFFVALSAGAQSTLPQEKNPSWESAREVATAVRNVVDKMDLGKSTTRERMAQVAALEKRVHAVFGGDTTTPRFGRCHQAIIWLRMIVMKQHDFGNGKLLTAFDVDQLTDFAVRFGDEWRSCRNAVNDLDVAPAKK